MSFNVRSFNANVENFMLIFENQYYEPDILVLCETFFGVGDTRNLLNYDAYHVVRPNNSRRGGVSVYVKNCFNSKLISHASYCNETIEIVTVQIKFLDGPDVLVCGIYRPHSDNILNFSTALSTILTNNLPIARNTIILGDLNLNLLRNDQSVENFMNCMQSFHFRPLISKPTRFSTREDAPSLLDHIWVNYLDPCISGIISIDITDHCPIFVLYKRQPNNKRQELQKITFRDKNPNNADIFYTLVQNHDWSRVLNSTRNVSERMELFISELNGIYNSCFPIRSKFISLKRISKPWLSQNLYNLIKAKSHYFKSFKRGLITGEANRRFKNYVTNEIKRARNNYYHNIFLQYKNDARKTWQVINDLLGNNVSKKIIKYLLVNNIEYTDSSDIANIFSQYFANIPSSLEANIPPTDFDPLSSVPFINNSIFLHPVSSEECLTVIKGLKNSKASLHEVPVSALKTVSPLISHVLAEIFSDCLTFGVFPECLKTATIIPIKKSGSNSSVSSYRPISILPYYSKILEKLIFKRLDNFLTQFQIVCPNQYGFSRGKTTELAMLDLLNYFYDSLDNRKFSFAVFVDFRKAFDTINHDILLRKLYRYGIRGTALSLFHSFLSDRKYRVKIQCSYSETITSHIGLPQGATLSPTLFLLYVNDLYYASPNLKSILFADDTTLLFSNSSFDSLVSTCNSELAKFNEWSNANKLSLNTDKTHVMIVSNRKIPRNPIIMCNSIQLEIVTECVFLGVRLDCALRFSGHTKYVASKISKSLGILYRLKQVIPQSSLLNLYYSFIFPYMLYCNLIWGRTFKSHLNPIYILQKRAIRMINNKPPLSHTNPLFAENRILKLYDINNYCVSIYVYNNLSDFVQFSTHGYPTRTNSHLRPEACRTVLSQRRVSYLGPVTWNNLPPTVKSAPNVNILKSKLKLYFTSTYNA